MMHWLGYRISLLTFTVIRTVRAWLWRARGRGPISGARTVIVAADKILLVRHYLAPRIWILPGGGIEPGERPDDAADREVKEETGLHLRSKHTIGVFPLARGGETHVYYSDDFEGEVSPTVKFEIKECRWFPLEDLPQEIFSRDREHIEKYLKIKK
jgi:ADP-ribose pyrophosphatase YjhB (NUDIX family)